MDEQEAIQSLKRGDIGGLEVLVTCYQVKAIRAAYLITRDQHMAQDVMQDVFLQVYRSIGGFDANRRFESWFMRSVVNAALKAARKAARQLPSSSRQGMESDEDEAGVQSWLVAQDAVEGQVESAESDERIWQAMRELSPRQRAVIVQRYFLEMSEKEMALELDAAPGTVKWLLNAARLRLRSLLGPERSDP
ncbi:MAG: sigma-70 family RNA polymerase sigma factor [Anaerolineales bacterium]